MIYHHILVALDGSQSAHEAIKEAIKFANDIEVILRLVHVVDENIIHYGGPGFDNSLIISAIKEEGKKILKEGVDAIKSQTAIRVESALLELKLFQGRIADAILEEAQRWPADLLIMGTHGRKGLSHFFLGSVAEQMLKIATVPLLLVREKEVKKHG